MKTTQELVHWLEMGRGSRWVRGGAVVLLVLVGSLLVSWTQFHGPVTEGTILQADMGRQLASGEGFTTLVNFPQVSAVLERRGQPFSEKQAYPELYQAPLYSIAIAAVLRAVPSGWRESILSAAPVERNGFGGDYLLLGLNLVLFWLAAWLTFDLGRRLFSVRVGRLAALALLVSVAAWQQVVAVNGVPLLMVLALLAFRLWHAIDAAAEEARRAPVAALAGLGAICGLLFLAEYSAGTLVAVALAYAALRFRGAGRAAGLALIAAGFLAVSSPWMVRNLRVAGNPVALAAQNVALKAGDPTAEPATVRTQHSAEMPKVDLDKLGNKVLTNIQENVKSRLWAGGGLFLTAFFVAGWLYAFRAPAANRIRWVFTISLLCLVVAQAFLNSGETERLPVFWLAPLVIIFGAGFFFVLIDANPSLSSHPVLCAAALVLLQALPLVRDALEPRRLHFSYPPYYPALFMDLHRDLEARGAVGRYGVMTDVPAGAAWYGRQRVWAQPARLRDFYAIVVKQPVGMLLLTPRTLDRPFFSDLAVRGPVPGSLAATTERFGEWGQVYASLLTGHQPQNFPLTVTRQVSENLFVLFNPALPPIRGK